MTVAERKKDAVCLREKCGKAPPSAPGVPYQNTALYGCACVWISAQPRGRCDMTKPAD
jgi:hypothetical protein